MFSAILKNKILGKSEPDIKSLYVHIHYNAGNISHVHVISILKRMLGIAD